MTQQHSLKRRTAKVIYVFAVLLLPWGELTGQDHAQDSARAVNWFRGLGKKPSDPDLAKMWERDSVKAYRYTNSNWKEEEEKRKLAEYRTQFAAAKQKQRRADSIASVRAAQRSTYPKAAYSKWESTSTRDDFTDKPVAMATLRASQPVRSRRSASFLPELVIRCRDGEVDAWFELDGPTNDEMIGLRFDDRAPTTEEFGKSTDLSSLFSPYPRGLVLKVRDAKRLRMRFTPYLGSPQTTEFDITGLSDHFGKLYAAGCDFYKYR